MTASAPLAGLSSQIAAHLPSLRRYARALSGSQRRGDQYAIETLEAIVADPAGFDRSVPTRVGLFGAFHRIWSAAGTPGAEADDGNDLLETRAQWRLRGLDPSTREALLLRSVEGFALDEIGMIMDLPEEEAGRLVDTAHADMLEMVKGQILIIEDEAIIGMDLEGIVETMGHRITGVAATCDEALALGRSAPPDLILSDIQLADRSSGIDAVNTLLKELGDRPVIFITAFPERLLTGERPEPAFLITKPYSEDQVRAAVSQAIFFATTETMDSAA